MNLGWRDIRHQWPRFVATGFGLGLLFAVVLAMGGIYRGMIEDATLLIDSTGADLWIVQAGTRGPFAERSVIDERLETRAHGVPGVAWSRPFSTITVEPEVAGRSRRMTLVGLAWPDDRGQMPLWKGRPLANAHREIIVDRSLGLELDDTMELGGERYRVVGLGHGLVSSSGDGLAFVTQADLGQIQAYVAPEALRMARVDGGAQPTAPGLSAVLVKVLPGYSVAEVHDHLARWQDVSVYTRAEQSSLLVEGVVDKARRQIGLFRALLAVVSAIVVSLVIFNMTVGKTREIALLKLMGARLGVVVTMILQQSLLLTLLAYFVALGLSQVAFPYFPRRVVIGTDELLGVFVLALGIALFASMAAIRRALKIPPTTILAG